MSRTIQIKHNGQTYHGKVARITSTTLGIEGHGIATAYLNVEGDGWGVGVGGFCLDTPVKVDGKYSHREGTAFGFDHIMQLTRTVGSLTWEGLVGMDVIVLFEGRDSWGSSAVGIAHVSDESKVMVLKEHADSWKAAHAGEATA